LFEYDRDRWKPGETFQCKLWAVNDNWDAVPGATLRWSISGPGSDLPHGSIPITLAADSVQPVGSAEFSTRTPGEYQLHAELIGANGRRISENIFEFAVQ
jgi:hypothetical protein